MIDVSLEEPSYRRGRALRRVVDMEPTRDNYMDGILTKPLPPDKEIDRFRTPVVLAALRTSTHGVTRYFEGVQLKPGQLQDTCSQIIKLFNETVINNPDVDFITAGEHSLYFHPRLAKSLEFIQDGDKYKIVDGQQEIVDAIAKLQDIAKKIKTNICIGTVCEKQDIGDVAVYHNTAVTINNKGEIIQLRRKITGSEAIVILEEGYNINSYESREIQLHQYANVSLVPGEDVEFKTKKQQIMAQAFMSALDTIKPLELSTKKGDTFSVLINICAERDNKMFLNKAKGSQADVMIVVVNEGDDLYTKRSQLRISGDIVPESLRGDSKDLAENKKRTISANLKSDWSGSYFAEAAVHLGVLTHRAVWLASDSTFEDNGSAGIFRIYDFKSIKDVSFQRNYVVAHCEV